MNSPSRVLSLSGCRHSHGHPFRGMRRTGFWGAEALVFRCDHCRESYLAQRCIGRNKHGTRCRQPAEIGHDACRFHRGARVGVEAGA